MANRNGLFESGSTDVLGSAAGWLTDTLLGSVAVTLCILAVAYVGFMMVAGRLPVKHGLRVVLGCFILLGAPILASAFLSAGQSQVAAPVPPPLTEAEVNPRGDLPPADYDPYAGASVRRD